MSTLVGIDIGGTFTDGVAIDTLTGMVAYGKSPTTYPEPFGGVSEVLDEIATAMEVDTAELLGGCERLAHATTLTSNLMLERRGARVSLIATRGHGDAILMMSGKGRVAGLSLLERRHFRATDKPDPIVPGRRIVEAAERIDADGDVVMALTDAEIARVVDEVASHGPEACAVALLWSFRNPEHEHRLAEALAERLPDVFVSVSSDLAPLLGEYERTATAVVNSYVGPAVAAYFASVEQALQDRGLRGPLLVVQSSGGVARVSDTPPVATIESGPAAGVRGSARLLEQIGEENAIVTDVGGTTFKVSIVRGRRPELTAEAVLGQYSLMVPMIDVVSIGAGGGSIAWVDGERLRVGPKSAAADPGPACYGWGGVEPTVTDADVVLGYLDPDYFLGGRMTLDAARAWTAIEERIAKPLFGGDVLRAAAGIRRIIDTQMADLIRKASLERGHDPREFVLLAYGGAGPVHCGAYAADLGCSRIVVPPNATVYSAFGAATSDVLHGVTVSHPLRAPGRPDEVRAVLDDLAARAQRAIAQENGGGGARLETWTDMRYRRQFHELRIPIDARLEDLDAAALEQVCDRFEAEYTRRYGPSARHGRDRIEYVRFGIDVVVPTTFPAARPATLAGAGEAFKGLRDVFWSVGGEPRPTPIYDGLLAGPGWRVEGPAIIEHPGTAIVIHEGQTASVDEHMNTVIDLKGVGAMAAVDPVTFEVVWHKLMQLAEEMGVTYFRTTASHVVITGTDASSAIMTPDGEAVAVGPFIVTQANVLPLIVRSVIEQCGDDPGIAPGDMFICNDPYAGAIHQPDVAMVAPLFAEGRLVAWIGTSGHQVDNGGMDPGGFPVGATEVHQEGLRIPPVRIVESGRLREDMLRWIDNQVRDPLVALDVRAQFATLTVGARRFAEMVEGYGVDAVSLTMTGIIDYAERRFGEKLAELPDGEWTQEQFIDHDGHDPDIYRVACAVRKSGPSLTVDFSGSSRNAAGIINASYAGLTAGTLAAAFILLAHDLPWNSGIRRCIEIRAAPGTINNCAYPAPCSMATISATIVTIDAVWACFSRMLVQGDERVEAMANWSGTSMAPIFTGITRGEPEPFAHTEMSHFGGGGGARTYADGVDTAGIVFNTTPNLPNVETNELDFPVLYLFRRHLTDSGGPGRFRGGMSAELAYVPHKARGPMEGLFAGTGCYQPNALGLQGGLPASAVRVARVVERDAPAPEHGGPVPASLEESGGRVEILQPKHARTPLGPTDVWYHSWQAGGGVGDPIERDPERVRDDVLDRAVSREVAEAVYGVLLVDGVVDPEGTRARRARIRRERLGGEPARVADLPDAEDGMTAPGSDGSVACAACGEQLGTARPDGGADAALASEAAPSTAGPVRGEDYGDHGFRLQGFFCPGCARQLQVILVYRGDRLVAPPAEAAEVIV